MDLTSHIKSVNGTQRYNCISCSKSFTQASNLKHIHIVHEGRKDYKCTYCGKSFSEAGDLNKHIHTVHEGRKDQ